MRRVDVGALLDRVGDGDLELLRLIDRIMRLMITRRRARKIKVVLD